jgi:hypothetical protein
MNEQKNNTRAVQEWNFLVLLIVEIILVLVTDSHSKTNSHGLISLHSLDSIGIGRESRHFHDLESLGVNLDQDLSLKLSCLKIRIAQLWLTSFIWIRLSLAVLWLVFWHSRDDDDSLGVVDEGLVVPEAGGGGIPTDGRNNAAAGAGIDQCLHFDGKLTKTFLWMSFIDAPAVCSKSGVPQSTLTSMDRVD